MWLPRFFRRSFEALERPESAPDAPPLLLDQEARHRLQALTERVDFVEQKVHGYLELRESLQGLTERVDSLSDRHRTLTVAVDEGIQHVDRSERRVRAVVASAQKRFEAEGYGDVGVDAEAAGLPPSDAPVSPDPELPALPGDVDSADAPALSPGWSVVPGMGG